LSLLRYVVEVGDVVEGGDLFGYGGGEGWVGVSEGACGDAGYEVEVGFVVDVG